MRVFLNLCAGLDKLGVPYRVNDYRHTESHPEELACIIGKPHVLNKIPWRNPILFGAAVYSHPIDDPNLLTRLPVKRVLVPGEWMRRMCEPTWGERVTAWPVGIETEKWRPAEGESTAGHRERGARSTEKGIADFLIYDKVLWEHEKHEVELIQPIRDKLTACGLTYREIRYGFYQEKQYKNLLRTCRAMIFLSASETQGLAYQQALSCGRPILAWDRGGYWPDPSYYPHKVRFQPVSSVPYWDERCGMKFENVAQFGKQLERFWSGMQNGSFRPRDYILSNLTLEACAESYLRICESTLKQP